MNKKIVYFFFITSIIIIAFASCKKTPGETAKVVYKYSYNQGFDTVYFWVDSTSKLHTVNLCKSVLKTTIRSVIEPKGFTFADVKKATIDMCKIYIKDTVTTVPKITFAALDSVNATLSATGKTPLTISSGSIPVAGNTAITIDGKNTDFLQYSTLDSFNISITGKTRQPLPHKFKVMVLFFGDIEIEVTR